MPSLPPQFDDLRGTGHNRTRPPAQGGRLTPIPASDLRDLVAVIADATGGIPDAPYHLLGHGYGGMLLLEALRSDRRTVMDLDLDRDVTRVTTTTTDEGGLSSSRMDQTFQNDREISAPRREIRSSSTSNPDVHRVPPTLLPPGLTSLTLLSTPASYGDLTADRAKVAPPVALEADRRGVLYSDQEALDAWISAGVARRSRAGCVQIALEEGSDEEVYARFGSRAFVAEGGMKDWVGGGPPLQPPVADAIVGMAPPYTVPLLTVRGAGDELSDVSVGKVRAWFTDARHVEVPDAKRMVTVDEWEAVLNVVKAHLDAADVRRGETDEI